jgi:membrane fusion protein, multidrug efflux system
MLTAQRIEHSDESNEHLETSSDAKPSALRPARSEVPQKEHAPAREQPKRKRENSPERIVHFPQWKRRIAFALLPIALIAGAYWYVTGGQIMSTDDAYVEADKVGISTDVSGIVQDVNVTENQHVQAGQVLYGLDAHQF